MKHSQDEKWSRVEGSQKVTGKSQFVDDLYFPNMLHGRTLRSHKARGKIKKIEWGDAIDWSQFVQVTAEDIPGANAIPMLLNDCPFLAKDVVNYIGEPIVLIAHRDPVVLEEALRHIHVEIEELPPLFDMEDSLNCTHTIWGSDNVFAKFNIEKGNIADIFKVAEHIFEAEYRTGAQEQLYIENNGMIAHYHPTSGVTIWGSMQCPYYIHAGLCHLFSFPRELVRIIQVETGGAFGGKEDFPTLLAGHAALLAMKSGLPVKMIYSRDEDMAVTTKRHPSRTRHRTALDKNGKILAMDIDFLLDGGAYSTLSQVVLSRGCIHAAGPYQVEHVNIMARAVATNTPPNGAFRGFGAPQSIFALERHMDFLAKKMDMTPDQFRMINYAHKGDRLATGQVIRERVDFEKMQKMAFDKTNYFIKKEQFAQHNRQLSQRIKKGIGYASFMHGAGFTGAGEKKMASIAGLEFTANNRVMILASSTEMGQGRNTVFARIVAEALRLAPEDIETPHPDTARDPNSGPTVASRTTMVVGELLQKAAFSMVELLVQSGYLQAEYTREEFFKAAQAYRELHGNLRHYSQYSVPNGISWDEKKYQGDAYATFAWAVYLAEVSVDLDSYQVTVDQFYALQEVGRVVLPELAEGQIHGGVAQGIGYALSEKVQMSEGRMINNRMSNYIMPTSLDLPEIEAEFLEWNPLYGPDGAKGIGELPLDGSAPAVINALCDALDIQINSIPALPELILDELIKQGTI